MRRKYGYLRMPGFRHTRMRRYTPPYACASCITGACVNALPEPALRACAI
nr:hypothetical protein PIKIBBIB_00004 [Gallid alphaherpesvirus 2]